MAAKVFTVLAVLAFACGLSTFAVESSYAGRAQLIQRVEKDETADALFGEADPIYIGTPQLLVIDDKKAFLEGSGPEGSKLVDEDYLTRNEIYPLQLKTVEFVAGIARIGAFGATLVLGAIAILLWRRRRNGSIDAAAG